MPLSPPAHLTAATAHLPLILLLSIACLAILIAVPLAAARSHLHIPAYVGFAFFASILGFACGRVAGIRGIAGTPWGVSLAVVFFLLMAFALGSVLALLFYRDPPDL